MDDIKKKTALGRGLSSLLDFSNEEGGEEKSASSFSLPLDSILPGRNQPRQFFPETELLALAESVREKGVLQPILVRPHPDIREKFEIIAGERRWRAAQKAGLEDIPALIKNFTDAEALEVGLLENIQRQDLNPIEEAEGYRRLAEEFHYTQESLSRILGKSRSHIANMLRLLVLPKPVQEHLITGALSAGHGRTLVNAQDPEALAALILRKNLSVRQAEALGKQRLSGEKVSYSSGVSDPEKDILQNHLAELLGMPVQLSLKGSGGKIMISFKDPSELDHLLQKLNQLTAKKAQQPLAKVWVS